jgi:hypothetical protein
MSLADGSIQLPDRPGDGHQCQSELSKLFESDYADGMALGKRPVNKSASTGCHQKNVQTENPC